MRLNRCGCVSRCLLALLMFGCSAYALPGDVSNETRLLWLGSSSIYYHNQPKVCAEWLSRDAETPFRSELAGRSGTGIHVYLRDGFRPEYGVEPGGTVISKIAEERYDFVVLQVPAEFINGPEGEEHDASIDRYCQLIRQAGGTPVIYEMGWGRDESAQIGRQKIFAAAVRNRVTHFAPCSTAWARVRRERPDLDLQNPPDKTHPGTLGCYLNLCCLHAAISGNRPPDPPHQLLIWRHLSEAEKQQAREQVERTEFDQYDNSLPGWMKRLLVTAERKSIDGNTADYLQRVAWEEYQTARKQLVSALQEPVPSKRHQ